MENPNNNAALNEQFSNNNNGTTASQSSNNFNIFGIPPEAFKNPVKITAENMTIGKRIKKRSFLNRLKFPSIRKFFNVIKLNKFNDLLLIYSYD